IKPFANKTIAPTLRLSDPYRAGHTEVIFKDYLSQKLEAEGKESAPLLSQVTVSGKARVTAMARAISMAKNLGADFSGFSGTVSAVTEMAASYYGTKVEHYRQLPGVSEEFAAREQAGKEIFMSRLLEPAPQTALMEHDTYDNALGSIITGIKDQGVDVRRHQIILDGQGSIDEAGLTAQMQQFLQLGYTVIVKDQGILWEIQKMIEEDGTEKISRQTRSTSVTYERDDDGNKKLDENGKAVIQFQGVDKYLEEELGENEKVVFFYNLSACRGTDVSFASVEREVQHLQDRIVGIVDVHALVDSRTTAYDFEQLIKRDRGLKMYVLNEKTQKFEWQYMYYQLDNNYNRVLDPATNAPCLIGGENRNIEQNKYESVYNPLQVHFMGKINSERGPPQTQDWFNKEAVYTLFEKNAETQTKNMMYNGLAEIYDSVTVNFLEGLRNSARIKPEADIINELIEDFQNQSGIDTNIILQSSAQSGEEALQKKIDNIIKFLEDFANNSPKFSAFSYANRQAMLDQISARPKLELKDKLEPPQHAVTPIAMAKNLNQAVRSTNLLISRDALPAVAPFSDTSAVQVQPQSWQSVEEKLQSLADEVQSKAPKDTGAQAKVVSEQLRTSFEKRGFLTGNTVSISGAIFINALTALSRAPVEVQNQVEALAKELPLLRAIDLPDDILQKLIAVLFTLVDDDLVSLNLNSPATADKLINTLHVKQTLSGSIDMGHLNLDLIRQIQHSDDSLLLAKSVLNVIDANKHPDVSSIINNAVQIKEANAEAIKTIESRRDYLNAQNQKMNYTLKTDAAGNILSKNAQKGMLGVNEFLLKRAQNRLQNLQHFQNTLSTTIAQAESIMSDLGDIQLDDAPGVVFALLNPALEREKIVETDILVKVLRGTQASFKNPEAKTTVSYLTLENLLNFNTVPQAQQEIIRKELKDIQFEPIDSLIVRSWLYNISFKDLLETLAQTAKTESGPKSSLIGKFVNEYGEVVEVRGALNEARTQLILMERAGEGKQGRIISRLPLKGKADAERVNYLANELSKMLAKLSDKDLEAARGVVNMATTSIKNETIHYIGENKDGVIGFSNESSINLSEILMNDSEFGTIVFFHEAGEAFFAANPGSIPIAGISAHIYLRGCGEDVRIAIDEVIKSSQLGDFKEANDFIKAVDAKLRGQYKRKITPSEQKFIEAQFQQAKEKAEANGSVDFLREAAYGLQDRLFGEKVNVGFTEKIKVIRGKMVIARLAMPTTVVTQTPFAKEIIEGQRYEIPEGLTENEIKDIISGLEKDINKDGVISREKISAYRRLVDLSKELTSTIVAGQLKSVVSKSSNVSLEDVKQVVVRNNFSDVGNITAQLNEKGAQVKEQQVVQAISGGLTFASLEPKANIENVKQNLIKAIAEFDKLSDKAPEEQLQQAQVYGMLSEIYKAENNPADAIKVLTQAMDILNEVPVKDNELELTEMRKELLVHVRFERAVLSANAGDFAGAEKDFKEAEKFIDVVSGELDNNIGVALINQTYDSEDEFKKAMDEALVRFSKAKEKLSDDSPLKAGVYMKIASILTQRGQLNEAFNIMNEGYEHMKGLGKNISDNYRMHLAVLALTAPRNAVESPFNNTEIEDALVEYKVINKDKDTQVRITLKKTEARSLIMTRQMDLQRKEKGEVRTVKIVDHNGNVIEGIIDYNVEGRMLQLTDAKGKPVAAVSIISRPNPASVNRLVQDIRKLVPTATNLEVTLNGILAVAQGNTISDNLYKIHNPDDIHMANGIMSLVIR
ncbi:MAG: hypothetical protein ABIH42_04185, partial [Planctomycetota bacterium]